MSKHILRNRTKGFTVVSNSIINALKSDLKVLGFYVYLLSLPHDWEFYKTNLAKTCAIGVKKVDEFFAILRKLGLLKVAQIRDEKGRFAHLDIEIYDTEDIKINNLDFAQPTVENCRTAVTDGRSQEAIKETYTKETNYKQNKEKLLCATNVAQPHEKRSRFNEFWKAYPRKRDKQRARKIWEKQKLDEKADKIIADVLSRIKNDSSWQTQQYICYPERYLKYERWEDEIEIVTSTNNKKLSPGQQAMADIFQEIREGKLQ